jgi:hypothetical protein
MMRGAWADAKLAIALYAAPLAAWMAAGWAAYPYALDYIYSRSGEDANFELLRWFSYIAAAGCLAVSAFCAAYYMAKRDDSSDASSDSRPCPYCGEGNARGSESCAACGRRIG